MNSAAETVDPIAAIAPRPAPPRVADRMSGRDDAHASSFADHVEREAARSDAAEDRRDARAAAKAASDKQTASDAADDASITSQTERLDEDQPVVQTATETSAQKPEKTEQAVTPQHCAFLIQSLADENTAPEAETPMTGTTPKQQSAAASAEIVATQDNDAAQADALKSAAQAPCAAPAQPRQQQLADKAEKPNAHDEQKDEASAEPTPNPIEQPILALVTPPPAPQTQQAAPPKTEDKSAAAIDTDAPRAPSLANQQQKPRNASAAPAAQAETPKADAAQSAPHENAQPEHAEARSDAPSNAKQTAAPRDNANAAPQNAALQTAAAPAIHPSLAPPSAAIGAAQASSAQSTAADAAARAAPAHAQVGREIVRRFDGENTKFELRLDPPELGRVEIKLEVSRDHKVNAIVSADNPQTLADLTRSARDLTQALQSAGLELNDNGLSFDLSQRQPQFSDQQSGGDQRQSAFSNTPDIEAPAQPAQRLTLESWRGGRIDMVA